MSYGRRSSTGPGSPAGGSGGYAPTQYQHPSANPQNNFWGILIDQDYIPSELFCRLSDALFFYLDANAQAAYPNSGWIEPDKQTWWSLTSGTVENKQATEYVGKYAMASLYDSMGVPYQMAQVNGQPTPIVDRQGFLQGLIASIRTGPVIHLQKLNRSITMFGLLDPLTNQPFPAPIPANSMPQVEDWNYRMAFTQWQTSVARQYQMHMWEKHRKQAGRKRLVGGLVHTLSGGLGGGSGFGGFGGGGGVTGLGF